MQMTVKQTDQMSRRTVAPLRHLRLFPVMLRMQFQYIAQSRQHRRHFRNIRRNPERLKQFKSKATVAPRFPDGRFIRQLADLTEQTFQMAAFQISKHIQISQPAFLQQRGKQFSLDHDRDFPASGFP